MSEPKTVVRAVVAMASNRVIGQKGALPWRLPEDLKWFKRLTLGHPVVMGRKTMDSINKPLPKRRNVVISRTLHQVPAGFELAPSCEAALELLADETIVSVIGGAEIYRMMLPICEEVYLSYIFKPYEGDTTLSEFESDFTMAEVMYRNADFELRRYIR
jgi:dihydrofolate reductase